MNGWFDPSLRTSLRISAKGQEQPLAPEELRKALEQLYRSLPALSGENALQAWGLLGTWHRVLRQPEQAWRCHDQAVALAEALGKPEEAFQHRVRRAHARRIGGGNEEAEAILLEFEALIDRADVEARLHPWRAELLLYAGQAALEAEAQASAKAYLERSVELLEAGPSDDAPTTQGRHIQAQAAAALARMEQAIEQERDKASASRPATAESLSLPSEAPASSAQEPASIADTASLLQHNRSGWNRWARSGGEWSQPYSAERFEAARQGDVHVVLTPNKRVPADWLGALNGSSVLGLASGGGQQMPLFAAAGAQVTSFDLSDAQLARDSAVADAHGLDIRTVQGNMADLSALPSEHFDLIFHPVSNVFAPDLKPVWAEAFRVLKPGGRMLSGMMQPVFYCFDHQELDEGGPLTMRYSVPYSDLEQLPKERLEAWIASGEVLEFGHSLQDLLGLPLEAGFAMTGFYDDNWSDAHSRLNPYFPIFLATRLIKPVG